MGNAPRCLVFVVVAALVGAGCGGNGNSSTGPTPTTLAGTWKATRAEFVNAANTGERVEAIGQGASIVVSLQAGGSFVQQTSEPGEPTVTMTGTWTASQDVLTLKPTGTTFEIQFDMALNGNSLTLNGGHVQFDVDNDNQDEEAILNMTLTRQ